MWLWHRHDGEDVGAEGVAEAEVGRRVPRVGTTEWGGVVAEATALLEGRLADSTVAGWPRPSWVWVNRLAHGSWDELCDLSQKRHRWVRIWEGATTVLAAEMISYAGTPDGLLALQRGALIPLELDILAGRVDPPVAPLHLVAMVRAEIDRFRFDGHPCEGPR